MTLSRPGLGPGLGLVRDSGSTPEALAARGDDELMALARAGLRAAFAVLVERHARRVVDLCARFVNDAQQGQELAQDTWVMVWQARERYRGAGAFVPWLITVARNHCRNHLRRRKLAPAPTALAPDVEMAPPAGGSATQLDGLLLEERRRRVRAALAELSEPMREVLLLRYAEELPYDEMTSVVGTGESTLRSRVHHGLKALQRKLEDEA